MSPQMTLCKNYEQVFNERRQVFYHLDRCQVEGGELLSNITIRDNYIYNLLHSFISVLHF